MTSDISKTSDPSKSSDPFNGIWILDNVPDEFIKIMTILGYNTFEKKYLKKTKMLIHSEVKEDVLHLRVDSTLHKSTKKYHLNSQPIEITDDRKNSIMEVSQRINDNTIKINSIYLENGFTIMDLRTIVDDNQCHHQISLAGIDHDEIVANMIYLRHQK